MGEIKSVKVDNWGVFFLQKLQNFFNKTDYCDLTLQFNDNSQLKVHRLVLSACTDYFNVLEQTCEVIDDALLMPNELQADVVVPIVNFMYTGTLEFELKMYGKLLRTAKEMNMTVLLKLLEAHRRTMEGVNRAQQRPSSPKNIRKRGPAASTGAHAQMRPVPNSPQHQNQQQQQRRILTSANATPQRRLVQTKTIATNANQQPQVQQYRQQIGSTSLLKTSVTGTSPLKMQRSTFESTSYTSGTTTTYESTMQFKEEQQDDYEIQMGTINQSTSPFEQLRKGYNNNKRPASATFISPPAKKPNIEDVKEFSEQQRMRKQIAAEYGEDQEYEGPMLEDDIHNDDDDDDHAAAVASSSIATASTTNARQQQQQQGPSIIIKQEPNEKPTIVVKDSANSKMNHAKIISEVLRQYPHLVKSNKNIKLKIMPNIGGHSQKIIVKKEQIDNISAEMASNAASSGGQSHSTVKSPISQQIQISKPIEKSSPPPPQTTRATQQLATVGSGTAAAISTTTPSAAPTVPAQKRRIDSKTMHALIAQGAENTTGPWLCLRCGVNGRPISIPSYRGFRRHLINTHKETIDPALCEHCGWRSTTNRNLHFHTQVEHKIKTSVYTFPECLMCTEIFIDTEALNEHMVESHPDENQQQCIYCNKIFAKEIQLYTHMKTYHKKQAIDDGIIDYSDDEDEAMDIQEHRAIDDGAIEEKPQPPPTGNKDKKIKILSDISLPSAGALIKLEPSSEAAALTTIASGIAASIGLETSEEFISTTTETRITTVAANEATGEPKFVTPDGNEMVLTEEQRKEIMSQLNQEHDGGVVMVLNEASFSEASAAAAAASAETNEDTSQDIASDHNEEPAPAENEAADNADASADEDEYDDNNIYSEFVNKSVTEAKKDSSGLEESKGSIDNLEWAENLITAHEMEEETVTKPHTNKTEAVQSKAEDGAKDLKKNEDINKKLKELTGDWSDDEIDEDEEMEEDNSKHVEEVAKNAKTEETEDVENSEQAVVEEQTSKVELKEEEQQIAEEDKSTENVEMADIDNEEHRNDEPEDDIDIALKSLHQEDVETTDANVTDELHDTLDSEEFSSNLKEDNVSSEDKNIKNDSVEEPESMNIDLPTESGAVNAAIEENPEVSSVEDTTTSSDSKKTKDAEDESKISADETTLQESKEDATKKEDELDIKPDEEDSAATESALMSQDKEDNVDANEADENIVELKDAKKVTKSLSPASSVVETPKTPEATTSATLDTSSTTATTTEDKVKTLISEWGDDDDEIEDIDSLI